MYVCICNRVRDDEIVAVVEAGARELDEVSRRLGVATQCGKCARYASELIEQTAEQQDAAQRVA